MSAAYLGNVFDIHGGGLDLIFPHHENEIAQSRCAHGTATMANYWMHNGFLQVEGEKMSKSLGNFVTIRELLNDWPGEVLRLNMLKTHYRSPIDWTLKGLEESKRVIDSWYDIVGDDTQASGDSRRRCRFHCWAMISTRQARSHVCMRLPPAGRALRGSPDRHQRTLKVSAMLLGLLGKNEERIPRQQSEGGRCEQGMLSMRSSPIAPPPARARTSRNPTAFAMSWRRWAS